MKAGPLINKKPQQWLISQDPYELGYEGLSLKSDSDSEQRFETN